MFPPALAPATSWQATQAAGQHGPSYSCTRPQLGRLGKSYWIASTSVGRWLHRYGTMTLAWSYRGATSRCRYDCWGSDVATATAVVAIADLLAPSSAHPRRRLSRRRTTTGALGPGPSTATVIRAAVSLRARIKGWPSGYALRRSRPDLNAGAVQRKPPNHSNVELLRRSNFRQFRVLWSEPSPSTVQQAVKPPCKQKSKIPNTRKLKWQR